MSETSSVSTTTATTPQRGGTEIFGFVAAGVAALALLWLLTGGSERALQRGATGFDGLVVWLGKDEIEARSFSGGGRLVQGKVDLRILPLFDTDLRNRAVTPDDRAGVIAQTVEKDISYWVVRRKISSLPTMIVLPKWRAGMRKLGVAHRDLLIPEQELNRLLAQIGLDGARARRDAQGYVDQPAKGPEAPDAALGFFHGQTFRAAGCTPLIGTKDAMLLAECPIASAPSDTQKPAVDGAAANGEEAAEADEPAAGSEDDQRSDEPEPEPEDPPNVPFANNLVQESTYLVLADPDLMNNHGLSLGENGAAARQIVRALITDKPVIIDHSRSTYTVAAGWQERQRNRTWQDFARMFRWPFTMIWIAFGALGALILWRAITRYGPLARAYDDEPRASKEVSIEAKARLLRLSNHDGALLADHIKARLGQLVADLLGPHRPAGGDPLATLTTLVGRRSPELATELRDASALPAPRAPVAEILRRLDRFETCYDKVIHEFGRASDAG